jgi:WD repeat-containing protein 44
MYAPNNYGVEGNKTDFAQLILKRTHTEKSIPYKLRSQNSLGLDSSADGSRPSPTDPGSNRNETFPLGTKAAKEKK